jgi:hypothetical protein
MLPDMEIDGLKEATTMLLNDMICTDLNGEICFRKKNGATIKLGTFEFRPEYKNVKIILGDIAVIEYEGDNGEMSALPNMYWFRSATVNRYHGFIYRDDKWVNNLFEEVSPFTDDINRLLEEFFRIAFDSAQNMPGKQVV